MEPISLEKAAFLISQPPRNRSLLKDKTELSTMVNSVISRGYSLGLWEVFDCPSNLNSIGNWNDLPIKIPDEHLF